MLIVEEAGIQGGFGTALVEQLEGVRNGLKIKVVAIPDRFFEHGKREILLQEAGLTTDQLEAAAVELLSRGSVYAR